MDNYIKVGTIFNTFGIKGELKVYSDFEYSERVFRKGFPIYIGPNKIKEVIGSIRIHKNNYLVLLEKYDDINEVLKYKGQSIYIDRFDLDLNEGEYLLSDLIGFSVYDNELFLGVVIDYEVSINNVLLKVKKDKTFFLPNIDRYIKEIDLESKKIFTNNGSDLII